VREGVDRESGGRQVPWTVSSVIGSFVFRPGDPPPPPATAPAQDASFELAYWNSIRDSKNPALFRAYLNRYPNGNFREIAEAEIANLTVPPPVSAPVSSATAGFPVVHWHKPGRSVPGQLTAADGMVRFSENGPGADQSHDFDLACASIMRAVTNSGSTVVRPDWNRVMVSPSGVIPAGQPYLYLATKSPDHGFYFSATPPRTEADIFTQIRNMCFTKP
jgi:hypothetical protein